PEHYPNYRSDPDGLPWSMQTGRANATVLMDAIHPHEGYNPFAPDTPEVEPSGRFNQLIGRLCASVSPPNCRLPFSLGSDSVVCGAGTLQLWFNGMPVLGGAKGNGYFAGGEYSSGAYHYSVVVDDIAARTCASHPHAVAVSLSLQTEAKSQ
ncbi:MAG TPA: hypothetical protein VG897_13610, partial [Terriglobales bacterium]|nr:hypothetical protein [Terriglobales bacterium]